ERRQRRSLGDQPDDLVVARLLLEDPFRFRIKRREGRDGADEHPHRVGVMVEAVDELLDVLVNDRVVRDLVDPAVQLGGRRKLPVEEQIRGLEERALLGELLDRVAAVLQDSLVAVDERDGAAARRRVHEGGVVRHQPEIVVGCFDLAEIGCPNCSVLNRQLVAFAGAVVDDRERVLRHYGVLDGGAGKDNANRVGRGGDKRTVRDGKRRYGTVRVGLLLPSLTVLYRLLPSIYLGEPCLSPVRVFIPRVRVPVRSSASNSPAAAISPAFCWASRRKAWRSPRMPPKQWAPSSTSSWPRSSSWAPISHRSARWPNRRPPRWIPIFSRG